MDANKDKQYMQRALDLALKAAGRTSPNPMVGCVIVNCGEIVGEGYHQKAGTPHAEIHALKAAGEKAGGADVYVTLEPCSHYGRTPPCADALIKAGVRRVVIAMTDPNPLVDGRGIKKLREAGIIVETGVLENEAKKMNEAFLKAVTSKKPFVLYKAALTLDGKTAVQTGDSKWITSEGARQYVHELRNTYDVIMVGSRTVLQDNPFLTCRNVAGGRNPVRLIVDSCLALPPDANVFSSPGLCIVAVSRAADPSKTAYLQTKENVEVWSYPSASHVPLTRLMQDLAARGYNSVLLEGGGTLAGKMLQEQLIDKIEFILAPKLAGCGPSPFSGFALAKMADALALNKLEFSELDGNYKFSGYINYDNWK